KALVQLETAGRDMRQTYRDAIEEEDGQVVVLGQTCPPLLLVEYLESLDGVLLPGGIDVDPVFYGEAEDSRLGETDASLDQFEFHVLDHARRNRLPVLGICRGHQVMNVYYGGSLIQDIPSQYKAAVTVVHRASPKVNHLLLIEPATRFHRMLQTEQIVVNTSHHQAVKQLADGFIVTARSEDGIVEAMEHKGDIFIVGVQFHPERRVNSDIRMKAIFTQFVEEASKTRKRQREGKGED
ncbi:MAG: gamma-glutamyl-gamma-aminobutyrate hydrolase family protein, partial [Candidatus Hydrogenedentes bacterium]|nr:gamma-glutamyl-gamma-aminobutyrate hydrolase family protein [Candidatus Hydrogenedentota bacterium]